MLSEAEIATYHEKGYVVPDYRLPEETLERIRLDHSRLLAKHPEFRDNCSSLLRYEMGFLNYALDPGILDMAEQVIGPDICLWNMSFLQSPRTTARRRRFTRMASIGQSSRLRPVRFGLRLMRRRRRTGASSIFQGRISRVG